MEIATKASSGSPRVNCWHYLLVCLAAIAIAAAASAARADEFAAQFGTAAALRLQDKPEQAVPIYQGILQQVPGHPRAVAELGETYIELADPFAAVQLLEGAVSTARFSPWEAKGLAFLAKACHAVGCLDHGSEALVVLQQRYPDSAWTTRAEALFQGDALSQSLVLIEDAAELAFDAAFDTAMQPGMDAAALAALAAVESDFAGTRTAVAATRSRLMVLTRNRTLTDQAIGEFEAALPALGTAYPSSKIVCDLRMTLAHLYSRQANPEAALEQFEALVAAAPDAVVRGEAMAGAAGAAMEVVLQLATSGQRVDAAVWESLRQRCQQFLGIEGAAASHRSRLEVMALEALLWQRRHDEALGEALDYLTRYGITTDRSGYGTVRLILGECFQQAGMYQEALAHYQWVVESFGPGDADIWPRIHRSPSKATVAYASAARAHYRIYQLYVQYSTGIEEQAQESAQAVLDQFPGTRYAELIQRALANREP